MKEAETLLEEIIENLELCLQELSDTDESDLFCHGEKTAYIECLEWIQDWEKASEKGLNFDIEKRYPL